MAKYPYAIKSFPRDEFTRLVKNPGNESGPKREAIGITRELLEHFSIILKGLMKLLKGHNGEALKYVAGEPRAICDEIVQGGSFAIPYYSEKLIEGSFFGGMTVRDALTDLVSIGLLFVRFVHNEHAGQFLSILEKLDLDIKNYQESLRRLASAEQFHRIRKQYAF